VTRQKLVPVLVGKMLMAVAGSGDGDLIDAFVARLSKSYSGSDIAELDSAQQVVKDELAAFAKEKGVRIRKIDGSVRLLFGTHSEKDKQCGLWKTVTGDPVEVHDYALIGAEDERYDYAIRNFYRRDMPISQGVFLGLYLMWLAEQTSNYVKAPISVAILKNNGLQFEDQDKIASIDQKVRLFTTQFEAQFLACSDTGLQGEEFGKRLVEFGVTVAEFRREFIEEWVGHAIDTGLDRVVEQWNPIPAGTTVVTVPLTPDQHKAVQEQQARLAETLRNDFSYVQEPDRIAANLKRLKLCLEKSLAQQSGASEAPTSDENKAASEALGELLQAMLMGAHKVDERVCVLLQPILEAMPIQVGFGEHLNPALQKANTQMRIALIDRVLAYLQPPTSPAAPGESGQ